MKAQRWFDFQCALLYLPRCNTVHKGVNPSTESLVMKMPTCQSDEGNSGTEAPYSQMSLVCVQMKKVNHHSDNVRPPHLQWRKCKGENDVTTAAKVKLVAGVNSPLRAMGGAVQQLSELARGCYQGRNWNSGMFHASLAEQGGVIRIQTIAVHRRWPCSVLKPIWAQYHLDPYLVLRVWCNLAENLDEGLLKRLYHADSFPGWYTRL